MNSRRPTTPRATYRLQFSKDFRFEDATRIVRYLAEFGISHVYASPLLKARPGSTHGYDIVDHAHLNPEIGSGEAFDAFVDELHRHGLGLIVDFVPNHMGVGPDNPWWVDVLEWGTASPYADFFDIDWEPLEPTLSGKVLLPVLGDHYGAVLERGELKLDFNAETGRFSLVYFDNPFPIAPERYAELLSKVSVHLPQPNEALGAIVAAMKEALSDAQDRSVDPARRGAFETARQRLAEIAAADSALAAAMDATLSLLNGTPGEPGSFDDLHRLLDRQAYRLAFWRAAAHEINYRRFFDINDLAGLRMDQPELFEASHPLIRRWIEEGKVDGLRLDHIDGLRDPKAYFERLQRLGSSANAATDKSPDLPVFVEKILAAHENLRSDWAVSGTTGYEFMSEVNGLFIDQSAERRLTQFYAQLTGGAVEFEALAVSAKRQIMDGLLASELSVLANAFNRLARQSRTTRDFTFTGLQQALENVVAHFPVYRTYVTDEGPEREDRRDIEWAVGLARQATRTPDLSIYDFIQAVLTLDILDWGRGYRRPDVVNAVLKFQQYTGPVMAKAMEDTTFYRYVRFVSLNEVGSEPIHFGTRPVAFHDSNARRQREHPNAMLATATHDHKRGEDVRARLDVISEMPRGWANRIRRWMQLNRRKRREIDGHFAPDRNDEYLFYQTVVGAWPHDLGGPDFEGIETFSERIAAYMQKAAREAKRHTSWAAPDEDYEKALSDFVGRTLDPKESRPLLEDISALVSEIAAAGASNGLAQVLLKCTSPGFPDTYQGTEFWDLSLVDPDNRRPVDYRVRQEALAGSEGTPDTLLGSWRDGRIKQWTIQRVLGLRRQNPTLFADGDYRPLAAAGEHADRLVAFARVHEGDLLVCIVPRLVLPLIGDAQLLVRDWADTQILLPEDVRPADGALKDAFLRRNMSCADGRLAASDVLGRFPMALLVGRNEGEQRG